MPLPRKPVHVLDKLHKLADGVRMKIVEASMIHPLVAEIKGTGRSRTRQELVVYFTRKGEVDGGFQFLPEIKDGYLPTDQIPAEALDAARKVYRSAEA